MKRKVDQRQTAMPIDMRTRPPADLPSVDMRTRELGSWVGMHRGKNVYVDLCDICHTPAVKLNERFYHRQPCDSSCHRASAPYPAASAMRRLRRWFDWAQAEAAKVSLVESERARALESIVHPMRPYLLQQIVRTDRRNLPSVLECRQITEAMQRTGMESDIMPIEFEEWTPKAR